MRKGRDVHINVILCANQALGALEQICRRHGLTHQQYIALWVLCLCDDPAAGVPVGAIADGLLTRSSDVTRLVDRLVRADLAERLAHPTDRRAVLVRATPAGQKTFDAVTPEVQELHRTQWSNLTAAELDRLDDLLTKALWGLPAGPA